MRSSPLAAVVAAALLFPACRTTSLAGGAHVHDAEHRESGHHDAGHDVEVHRPAALGMDFSRGWSACPDHSHESRCGTPYVHSFHTEPAFLGRDLLVHAEREGDEHVVEPELEWALTRRLLLVAELPYTWTDDADGLGDSGLGLRGLFLETDRLLLSGQVSFEFPTGVGGLGAGETAVAPSLLAWADLGGWVTAQAGLTFACGTESHDTEVSWGAVLTKSFPFHPLFAGSRHDDGHGHASVLSLMLEGRGAYGLSGAEEGASSHEALLGVVAPFTRDVEIRTAWTLRWDDEDGATSGWVVGLVFHL